MLISLEDKLGLSYAKLSLALASYLLLWTSCEFDMEMNELVVNKSLTSHEQVMNKSWTSHEQVVL